MYKLTEIPAAASGIDFKAKVYAVHNTLGFLKFCFLLVVPDDRERDVKICSSIHEAQRALHEEMKASDEDDEGTE